MNVYKIKDLNENVQLEQKMFSLNEIFIQYEYRTYAPRVPYLMMSDIHWNQDTVFIGLKCYS